MFVTVGSLSNVNDSDTLSDEKNRANILEFNQDGSGMRIYASGTRNPGGGVAINPKTGELWCSVNERDGLGDNLVPDYITDVQEGGFYGWPWWYMGGIRILDTKANIPSWIRRSSLRTLFCNRTMRRFS